MIDHNSNREKLISLIGHSFSFGDKRLIEYLNIYLLERVRTSYVETSSKFLYSLRSVCMHPKTKEVLEDIHDIKGEVSNVSLELVQLHLLPPDV